MEYQQEEMFKCKKVVWEMGNWWGLLIWSLEAMEVRFMITKTDYYEENFALPGNLIANIMDHYKDMDVNFAIHGDGVLYTPKEDETYQNFI